MGTSGPDGLPAPSMNHVLVSGCLDSEYSYDAVIEGDYHGAMTFHAIRTIADAGYEITYAELAERLTPALEAAGYAQHPQLEARSHMKHRQVFG
jgi:hypothetical protein